MKSVRIIFPSNKQVFNKLKEEFIKFQWTLVKKKTVFLAYMHFLLYLCSRNQTKTVKTLHFDATNTMYISARRIFGYPSRAGVFVCVLGRQDDYRLFRFDNFDFGYVYCCFGMYCITMPLVVHFLRRRNDCGLVVVG